MEYWRYIKDLMLGLNEEENQNNNNNFNPNANSNDNQQDSSNDLDSNSNSNENDKNDTSQNSNNQSGIDYEESLIINSSLCMSSNDNSNSSSKYYYSTDESIKCDEYSIIDNPDLSISELLIKNLISKFLTQRFCSNTSDLNNRSYSLDKSYGFNKWDIKNLIIHNETSQVTKMMIDKYSYSLSNGKNSDVPLAFYFDMSCSMSNYTDLLSLISFELLKKNVKVLIGFNDKVNVQIDSIKQNMDLKTLSDVIKSAGYYVISSKFIKNKDISYKFINESLDSYLIKNNSEKCVVFSDSHIKDSVSKLSNFSDVYWFYFGLRRKYDNLDNFNGFIYPVSGMNDLIEGIKKANNNSFKNLCIIENDKLVVKKKGAL